MSRDQTWEEQIVERAIEYVEAIDEPIAKQFEGAGPKPLGDREFAMAVMDKLLQFPPQPIVFPDGSTRVVSPFLAALGECEGGRPVLHRIKRLGIGGI
jgi:hypothetical protein